MGTPDFSVPTLQWLISSEHEVVVAYTQPDKSSGRGLTATAGPIKRVALAHGLAILQPATLRDKIEVERLINLKPDAIVVAAYGRMLPQAVLDIPKFGCLNVHASLLPKYRGASPIAGAILAGDEETGVTIMLIDATMDTGPILSQKRVPIDPQDTTESLETKLAEIGADLMMQTLPRWFDYCLTPQPQKHEMATYTKPIAKSEGEIDWNLTAVELSRRVRAFYPWPGCYTRWQGKTLKILEAIALPSKLPVEPGKVVSLSDSDVPIGAGTREGVLGLRKIQLEGKKAISVAEFVRGQRGFIGEKLG